MPMTSAFSAVSQKCNATEFFLGRDARSEHSRLRGPIYLLVRDPCSDHWNEAFWRGRPLVQSALRPERKVMSALLLVDDARLLERVEDRHRRRT